MTSKSSDRLAWAVEALDIGPNDRILELGSGHGVAVSLVCELLDGGRVTALDRSPKMIEMAEQRNRAHAEKVRFIASSIEDADLGDQVYDKVFAVNVAALHKPGKPLEVVRQVLAPGGSLHLFSQAPGWNSPKEAERFGAQLSEVLEGAGFIVEEVRVGGASTGFEAGVAARAAS